MGLDMYLSARLYTSEYFNKEAYPILRDLALPGVTWPVSGHQDGIITLEVPVMYWRKANALHAWFVTNCQDGEDDCRTADVSCEQLHQLFRLVGDLLDAHRDKTKSQADVEALVKEKLPPVDGFFFGGTDIDQYFWEDLQNTHDLLVRLVIGQLNKGLLKGWDFTYHASW